MGEMLAALGDLIWNTPKVMMVLSTVAALLITCLFGIYQFNVWQIKQQKLQDQASERQARKDKVNERRRIRREERLRKELEAK